MGVFFAELAKKLADRWITLLVLPGTLFTAATWIGIQLRHTHAWDGAKLQRSVSDTAAAVAHQTGGTQAILFAAVLLMTAGIGLAVQVLAGPTRQIWLGRWSRLLALIYRWRVRRRRTRWHRHVQRRRELEQAHSRDSRTADQQHAIDTAAERVNRLALAEPGRPTWMGDRIHAVEQITLNRYGLDLAFTWPRLWLLLPDVARTEITTAHANFAAAVAISTWTWPYLLLATLWWPAALIGTIIGITGWARARAAITDLTTMSEAALDLHGRTLAITLGIAQPHSAGPLTITEGEKITAIARKGR